MEKKQGEIEREDGYYLINGKRVLYWQDNQWWFAVKFMNRYSGNIMKLDRQPKVIKSCEPYNTGY